jgi:arylsulfatase A-like enzyme
MKFRRSSRVGAERQRGLAAGHAFAVLTLALLPALVTAAVDRPNILLVLSDDHSVPHLGCYGSPNAITPHLDAFAAQGMRFNRAYTTAPQCAPSRGSIFTGRSPGALRITRFMQPPPKDAVFFSDVLRTHGYWAGIDGRHHHLDGARIEPDPHVAQTLVAAGLKNLDQRFDHVRIVATKSEAELTAIPTTFGQALDKVPAGKPFFLYFGFSQPHRRWTGRAKDVTFDPAKLKLPPDYPDLPEVRADYSDFLYSVYDLDRGFGRLLQELSRRGFAENTIVIFMGDNGESLLRGKGTLYDRGTHVPLIVRWPGTARPGSHSDILISGEDIAPTVLQALGLPAPAAMTGVSFLPALQGQPFPGREQVFAERGWHAGPITRTDGLDLSRSVTTKRYRYIYNLLPDRTYTPVDMPGTPAWAALGRAHRDGKLSPLHERLLFAAPRPTTELYDLEADPYELNNLSGQSAVAASEAELRGALTRWMVREADFVPPPSPRWLNHR